MHTMRAIVDTCDKLSLGAFGLSCLISISDCLPAQTREQEHSSPQDLPAITDRSTNYALEVFEFGVCCQAAGLLGRVPLAVSCLRARREGSDS